MIQYRRMWNACCARPPGGKGEEVGLFVFLIFFLLMSVMTTTPSLSTHLYFRCEDSDHLLLVDRVLFTGAGNIPSHNWFAMTFSGKTRPPDPLPCTADFPVYYLPIPYAIMLEMLRLLRLPPLMEDAWDHMPQSLFKFCKLGVWRAYLERYNFVVPNGGGESGVASPVMKKPKLSPDAIRARRYRAKKRAAKESK